MTDKIFENCQNINELLSEDNQLIFKILFENKHLLENDLGDEITPLSQHHWETMSRRISLHGLSYSWKDLRRMCKYWVTSGRFNAENYAKICRQNIEDDDISQNENSHIDLNISQSDFEYLPHTSTPKTPNIYSSICKTKEQEVNTSNKDKFVNKSVQTSLSDVPSDVQCVMETVFYVDPKTLEVEVLPEKEVAVILESTEPQNYYIRSKKKRKVDMTVNEMKLTEQQEKLFQQKLQQEKQQHELKMKFLQNQLKSEAIEIDNIKIKQELLLLKKSQVD